MSLARRRLLISLAVLGVLVSLGLASTASATSGYNGAAAAAYADTYWQTYNPAWPSFASQGDIVLYDFNNDGIYDHESIVVASDGTNPDGSTNWDLVDAHTNNRYHAYWTLAQYNANWATTRLVVLHIPPGTS